MAILADGCTAAITHDGELYTWGDGAGGCLGYGNTLRQFIPRQVEKGLGDFSITQVLQLQMYAGSFSIARVLDRCKVTRQLWHHRNLAFLCTEHSGKSNWPCKHIAHQVWNVVNS